MKTEEFTQIKLILDTNKNKLELNKIQSHQWKGIKMFKDELDQEILLMYSTIKDKIAKYEGKILDFEGKQIKMLQRNIQALKCLFTLKYDCLILIEEEDTHNQNVKKGDKHEAQIHNSNQGINGNSKQKQNINDKYASIKAIIGEKSSEHYHNLKTLEDCKKEISFIKMKLI